MALAGWVLWGWWHRGGAKQGLAIGQAHHGGSGALGCWALAVLLLAWRLWRRSDHHPLAQDPHGRRAAAEIHLMRRELQRQRMGLPMAIALHVVGWGLSGVQVWLAAKVMGVPPCSTRWPSRARRPRPA
jgi:hypothetical protein